MARPRSLKLTARLMLDGEIALGPGKADLLEAIARSGSISAAAREMGMSYARAWHLVDTMNRCFRGPLVQSSAGGTRGGGAQLTATGERVLAQYRKLVAAVDKAAAKHYEALSGELAR